MRLHRIHNYGGIAISLALIVLHFFRNPCNEVPRLLNEIGRNAAWTATVVDHSTQILVSQVMKRIGRGLEDRIPSKNVFFVVGLAAGTASGLDTYWRRGDAIRQTLPKDCVCAVSGADYYDGYYDYDYYDDDEETNYVYFENDDGAETKISWAWWNRLSERLGMDASSNKFNNRCWAKTEMQKASERKRARAAAERNYRYKKLRLHRRRLEELKAKTGTHDLFAPCDLVCRPGEESQTPCDVCMVCRG